jgi:hypothetical protein
MNATVSHPGVAGWYRRHRAAERLAPLADGTVDPWLKDIRPRLTPQQIDGAVAAAWHLQTCGLPPLFDVDTLRGMWKHGYRQLARHLYRLATGDDCGAA